MVARICVSLGLSSCLLSAVLAAEPPFQPPPASGTPDGIVTRNAVALQRKAFNEKYGKCTKALEAKRDVYQRHARSNRRLAFLIWALPAFGGLLNMLTTWLRRPGPSSVAPSNSGASTPSGGQANQTQGSPNGRGPLPAQCVSLASIASYLLIFAGSVFAHWPREYPADSYALACAVSKVEKLLADLETKYGSAASGTDLLSQEASAALRADIININDEIFSLEKSLKTAKGASDSLTSCGVAYAQEATEKVVLGKGEINLDGRQHALEGLELSPQRFVYGGIGNRSGRRSAREAALRRAQTSLRDNLSAFFEATYLRIPRDQQAPLLDQVRRIMTMVKADGYERIIGENYVMIRSIRTNALRQLVEEVAAETGVRLTRRERPEVWRPTIVKTATRSRLRLANTTRRYKRVANRDYYEFKLTVDAPADVLSSIQKVVYHLHRTFKHPDVTVEDPRTRFAYTWYGWGVFRVKAHVHYRDGRPPELVSHQLVFTE